MERPVAILVDQGTKDLFLDSQLKPSGLLETGEYERAGVPLTLRMQAGATTTLLFVARFIWDHLEISCPESVTLSHTRDPKSD